MTFITTNIQSIALSILYRQSTLLYSSKSKWFESLQQSKGKEEMSQ